MGGRRRAQFFVIAAVIIVLNLLAIGAIVRNGYRGGAERPSQEISIVSDFNRTISEIYAAPYSFRRNIQSFQLGIQKGSSFSSQIAISCVGKVDCSTAKIGGCLSESCGTLVSVKGSSLEISQEFSGRMGAP
ncbi:MAG: hypothetical protein V1820_06425 [archaeon]